MFLFTPALALVLSTTAIEDRVVVLEDMQVTIDLSEFKTLRKTAVAEDNDQLASWWHGTLGSVDVSLEVRSFSNEQWGFSTPEDLVRFGEAHYDRIARANAGAATQSEASAWRYDRQEVVTGPYGYVPYTVIAQTIDDVLGETGTMLFMAGVTPERSYTIEVTAKGVLSEKRTAQLITCFKDKVRYSGDSWNRVWGEEEVLARWQRDAPDKLEDDLEAFRTKHFLILTNSSGKKKFAIELEKSYEEIKKMYPFEEREELRLLPIFLFRTNAQYYDFCVKTIGWSLEAAQDSKGVAWRDFYATWYEAPKDPVHIHELTHKLFDNRMHLGGGGSWFQEGVAEYMSTTKNERKSIKRLVKKDRHVPFLEFMERRSLLGSSGGVRKDGTDSAHEAYIQAACIVEFVHQSKWSKGKLQDFIHAVGRTGYNDLEAIEQALNSVFGVGIEDFEEQFVKYWLKR